MIINARSNEILSIDWCNLASNLSQLSVEDQRIKAVIGRSQRLKNKE